MTLGENAYCGLSFRRSNAPILTPFLLLQAYPAARTGAAQRHPARGRGPPVHQLRGRRPQGVAVPGQGQHHQQHRVLRLRQRGSHRQGLPAAETRHRLRPGRRTQQDQDGRRGAYTRTVVLYMPDRYPLLRKSKLFQYLSLMAELGEGPPPAPKTDNKPPSGGGRGGFGNARGAQMFNQARPPAALMGPRGGGAPPPPPGESYESGYGGGGWGSGKPPSLMQQNVPPPSWSGRGGSGGGSWNQPPPPPGTTGPPARGSAPPPPPGERERTFHFSNL